MILWIKLPTRFYSFSWYFPAILFCFQICSSDLPWLLCGEKNLDWFDDSTLRYTLPTICTVSPLQLSESNHCAEASSSCQFYPFFVFGIDNKNREIQKQIPADEEDNAMEMPIQPSLSSESQRSSHAPGCKGKPLYSVCIVWEAAHTVSGRTRAGWDG